jgi:hypothetical protein
MPVLANALEAHAGTGRRLLRFTQCRIDDGVMVLDLANGAVDR